MRLPLVVIVALLLIGGCGGSRDAAAPKPKPSVLTTTTAPADPDAALKAAIRSYSKAYLTGDGATAYALVSKRCQTKLPLSEFAALTEQAKTLYGNIAIKSLRTKVSGSRASATYTFPVPAINQTDEPWVLENGTWHNDEC